MKTQRSGRRTFRAFAWLSLASASALLQVPACVPQEPAVIQYQALTILRSLAVDFLGYGLVHPFI